MRCEYSCPDPIAYAKALAFLLVMRIDVQVLKVWNYQHKEVSPDEKKITRGIEALC